MLRLLSAALDIPTPVYRIGEWVGAGFIVTAATFGQAIARMLWTAKNKKHGKSPGESWAEDVNIRLLLREARVLFNADRAFIAQFENGTHYINDQEKWRYSWTHEDADPGLAYMASYRRDIVLTWVPEEMKLIFEQPGPAFRTVRDLTDGTFRHMCAESGTEAVIRCIIRGPDPERPLGFIGLDFSRRVEQPAAIDMSEFTDRAERLLARGHRKLPKY